MRKLILGLAVSLDSFIEGPNGEYDWCFTDQDYGMSDFFTRIDSIFIGRKSYELIQNMSDPVPGLPVMKNYVFSNRLKTVKAGDEIITGDIVTRINEIRNEPGKDIWLFGGADLTAVLMNEKLVDELWLSVHPILLGSGKPLFTGITGRIPLELKESKTYSSGLVSLTYNVAR